MNLVKNRIAVALACFGLLAASLVQAPAASADGVVIKFSFADLKVTSADYFYLPTTLIKGPYLKFVVKNVGNADAGPFTVAVKNHFGEATLQTIAVSGLSAGASTTLYHPLPDCNAGKSVAWRDIAVDSTQAVLEIVETNNSWLFVCWDPPK